MADWYYITASFNDLHCTPDELEDLIGPLMEALVDLEEASGNVRDAAVGIDTGQRILDVDLAVKAADKTAAIPVFLTSLRAALRTVGVSIPDWNDLIAAVTIRFFQDTQDKNPKLAAIAA